MSINTTSDIVKNVARIDEFKPLINVLENNEDGEDNFGKDCDIGNGWTITLFQLARTPPRYEGKKKSLYVEYAVKNGKEVCLLNTSQYESVGDYDFVVFGDDRSAVEMFLKDFGIDEKIEDIDSVCQTS
jgi:hypothetical protein